MYKVTGDSYWKDENSVRLTIRLSERETNRP